MTSYEFYFDIFEPRGKKERKKMNHFLTKSKKLISWSGNRTGANVCWKKKKSLWKKTMRPGFIKLR